MKINHKEDKDGAWIYDAGVSETDSGYYLWMSSDYIARTYIGSVTKVKNKVGMDGFIESVTEIIGGVYGS